MTVPLIVNGVQWAYPQVGDTNWGVQATGWASAVTVGMLQRAGGMFTLTADVDFGASFGLLSQYYKTRTTNIATAGNFRLAKTDTIDWRNNANGANLALGIDGSDVLTFNGEVIPAGLIVNADVDPNAAIAVSKLAALTASRAVVTDASGFITQSLTTASQINQLNNLTGANVQDQLDSKLSLNGGTMVGDLILFEDPTSSFMAATKQYVDNLATGINAKASVRVATVSAGTLASAFANGQTVDGVTLATGNRILIKNQAAPAENGIYTVNASGAPTRATDADAWSELVGAFVFVTSGTANAATQWVCTVAPGGTIGVTAVTFVQFGAQIAYTADNQGVELTGSQFSLQIDGITLSQSGSGVKVAAGGITNTEVNASAAIAVNKLASLTAARAVITDGSGFLSTSLTTATQIAMLDNLSGANVQDQLDSKISQNTMTADGDLITRVSGIPAAIAISGTNNYILKSDGSLPGWAQQMVSANLYSNGGTTYSFPTSFTAITLGSFSTFAGTGISRSGNQFSMPFATKYRCEICFGNVTGTVGRSLEFMIYNVTGSSVRFKSVLYPVGNGAVVALLYWTAGSTSDLFEIRAAASGASVVANTATIDGQQANLYSIWIEAIRQF